MEVDVVLMTPGWDEFWKQKPSCSGKVLWALITDSEGIRWRTRYYETGEFVHGQQGKRVVFSWAKIIGQYVFWFASFYVQYQILR
ncbi:unnamed protein product [Nippostrongylus brasiliensis]|uniref:Ovule protein n=1 Tax=Nippostrongylus brasiliensis TaxID=27835 RepID=A0A0N4YZ78_NIPBR|nr:unnamed protein product [Nippostrongylus brasiliensis]